MPSIDEVRACFPTLQDGFAYLENAGGSQVPSIVADAVRKYMLTNYVQTGAVYPASRAATQTVADAHSTMATWVHGGTAGQIVLGPSSTALINLVAQAYGEILSSGDEIVIAETNHEANAGGWAKLEGRGATVKMWHVDPVSFECSLDELDSLVTRRTRIVAFPHVSNLLGEVVDVEAITQLVHCKGAKVFVDGVAYAPHGLIDVQKWGVDWYVFSNYKVYGPHMATLYGRKDAFAELPGPNHFFIPNDAAYKWELGSLNHEGCAGIVALQEYASFLAGGATGRTAVEQACQTMAGLERPLTQRLITYLESKPCARLIGAGSKRESVGTVSFLVKGMPSQEIPMRLAEQGIGIRAGNMYAVRLCNALGIDLADGVVRISLLHYNTMDEIERTIEALDSILP